MMKRKLFSLLLGTVAIFLLMGAGLELDSAEAVAVNEESAYVNTVEEDPGAAAVLGTLLGEAEIIPEDRTLLVDGKAASMDTHKVVINGVTYVSLTGMARELDADVNVAWDGGTVIITTDSLTLAATSGNQYIEVNGRFLFIRAGIQKVDGDIMIPLNILAKAFNAKVGWDADAKVVTVTRGNGSILSGNEYYNYDDLFWMSRVIFAESGNQPLEGQIGVGIVVLNRVESPLYSNTIFGVISQTNQFTTYGNGALANRTPNASSVLAAKLVLDGAMIEELSNATYFDSAANSWASRNKTCVAVIGNHRFYA